MILKIAFAVCVPLMFVLIWIIFTPVRFTLDSHPAKCEIKQTGTFTMMANYDDGLNFRLRVFGIAVHIAPRERPPKTKAKLKEGKKSGLKKSKEAWFAFIRNLANSLSCKKFYLDIDTDNVVLNAQLIPLALFAQSKGVHLSTNFSGRVYAQVEVHAHPNKILWAYFKFLTSNK
jgi:hypothetical protein